MERLLARCDGDISYLLHFFRGYKEAADAYYETPMATLDLDGLEIAYEQVQVRSPFDFPQHMWRSDGTRERVIADFVTDGHHPFDSLQGKVAVKVPGVDAFLLRDTEGNAQE